MFKAPGFSSQKLNPEVRSKSGICGARMVTSSLTQAYPLRQGTTLPHSLSPSGEGTVARLGLPITSLGGIIPEGLPEGSPLGWLSPRERGLGAIGPPGLLLKTA